MSFSTSGGVRYSRDRSSALGLRMGTVRFSVFGVVLDFAFLAIEVNEGQFVTVLLIVIIRTVYHTPLSALGQVNSLISFCASDKS